MPARMGWVSWIPSWGTNKGRREQWSLRLRVLLFGGAQHWRRPEFNLGARLTLAFRAILSTAMRDPSRGRASASLAKQHDPPSLSRLGGSAALRVRSHPPPKSTPLGFRVILPPSLPPSHGGKFHAGRHRLRASAIVQASPPPPPPSKEGGVSWQAAMSLGLRSLCLR